MIIHNYSLKFLKFLGMFIGVFRNIVYKELNFTILVKLNNAFITKGIEQGLKWFITYSFITLLSIYTIIITKRSLIKLFHEHINTVILRYRDEIDDP